MYVILLLLIIVSSLHTIIFPSKLFSTSDLSTSKPSLLFAYTGFILNTKMCDQPPPINQSTRIEIYNYIKDNPGIQFRGLCNRLNLSVGVAQYHLGVLTKAGLISIFKDAKYKRFFKSKIFTRKEMMMVSTIRHSTVRHLFSILLRKQPLWHKELASKLSISSQALTWQVNRLEEKGIIFRKKVEMKTFYFLEGTNLQILRRYKDMLTSTR